MGQHDGKAVLPAEPAAWKLLIIDDDPDVHVITNAVLRYVTFEQRPLTCISGYSGADARRLMQEHPDVAVILLDVVMETQLAGLEVVRYLREELGNRLVRIILRTGQSGQAPEKEVIADYDINDYREKADLSSRRLVTSVTVGLRGYRDLVTIQALEKQVSERAQALMQANQELTREMATRQQVEESLRRSQASLARAQAVAHMGNWDWNLQDHTLDWSDEIRTILGLAKQDLTTFEDFLAAVVDEEREQVRQTVQQALATFSSFRLDHRLRRPDGSERMVELLGDFFHDPAGRPCRMVGTIRDLTEQRLAENRLQIASRIFGEAMDEVANRLQLTTMAFENSLEGVMVTDARGIIQTINPAFTTITGYGAAEAVGQSPRLLHSGRQEPAFYRELWTSLLAHGRWQGTLWNRRRNGEAYPTLLTILAVKDARGATSHYLGVFHDLTDMHRHQEEMQYKTSHDSLTHLPNRDLFHDRLQQALNQASRKQGQLAVMILDLDLFHIVNNSLGHPSGDMVLQQMATRFQRVLREEDTVARLSGDEFAFIVQEISISQDAVVVVRKIMEVMSRPFEIDGHQLFITASIGIALYPNDGQDLVTLIRNAELGCARAKKAGRNTFQFYASHMSEQAVRRLYLEEQMRLALERGEFQVYYQPKVALQSQRIVSMEALVRWFHPVHGPISPGEFIPLAEETGLIVPMGEWILTTACRECRSWLEHPLGPKRLAINLSPCQFRHRHLLQVVQQVLRETGLAPHYLEFEITEGAVMSDVTGAIAIMRTLVDMGVQIAVDDFGIGYSSLNYLKRFPIHTLKIDQSFVRDLVRDPNDAAIVASIISLARNLHLQVVAEGVETEDQLEFLRRHHCDQIQGFIYSKPVPAVDFAKLLP